MFNFSEIIFIAVLALILIGPRQLPEVARNIGRLLNEFRRASDTLFAELKKPQIKIQPNVTEKNTEKSAEKNTTLSEVLNATKTITKNKDESNS